MISKQRNWLIVALLTVSVCVLSTQVVSHFHLNPLQDHSNCQLCHITHSAAPPIAAHGPVTVIPHVARFTPEEHLAPLISVSRTSTIPRAPPA